MQPYIFHQRGTVFYYLIFFFFSKSCFIDLLRKISEIIENIFFNNFRFTENMIFHQLRKIKKNMIFTLSVFTKMMFFMQCRKGSPYTVIKRTPIYNRAG